MVSQCRVNKWWATSIITSNRKTNRIGCFMYRVWRAVRMRTCGYYPQKTNTVQTLLLMAPSPVLAVGAGPTIGFPMSCSMKFSALSLSLPPPSLSSSKRLCSEWMAFNYEWNNSMFFRGTVLMPRYSRASLSLPGVTHSRNDVGITFARTAGQVERAVRIRFGDDATVTSEPLKENQLKVTVTLNSKATRKAFDSILESLRRSAPAVGGFRKLKGGKPDIPREILYKMLGPKVVDKFVIEEIVSSSVLDYVEKEGIKVKKDFKTVQSNDELAGLFKAGKEFEFEAVLELEGSETDATESSTSTVDGTNLESSETQ